MEREDDTRKAMVARTIVSRGVAAFPVLRAMAEVPRHRFVPPDLAALAYDDRPLPIGHGQTISQPFVVARMAEALRLTSAERVLEVGAGSGYSAVVLGGLAREVYSVEIVPVLAAEAARRVAALGVHNVRIVHGDGSQGLPELAPFDAISVTAAAMEVPEPLLEQLAPGGRMIIPLGVAPEVQRLLLISRDGEGQLATRPLEPVRFVRLVQGREERRVGPAPCTWLGGHARAGDRQGRGSAGAGR